MHSTCNTALCQHTLHLIDLVTIALMYVAYTDDCRHTLFIPAEAKAYPMRGHRLLFVCCMLLLVSNQRLMQVAVMLQS